MSFNPNAQLDPSQVEDERASGRAGGGGFGGGFPVGRGGPGMVVGGGGLGMLLLIAFLLLGGNPLGGSGNTYPDTSYQQPAQSGAPAGQSVQDCRTGEDANRRDDCRIVGF